jgi:hypothetical protein
LVERAFGSHTVDLMSSDSNAMRNPERKLLRHFTPWSMSLTAGVDVFAQDLAQESNPYVFPPYGMIFPVLSLLKEQKVPLCTCVLPCIQPVPL